MLTGILCALAGWSSVVARNPALDGAMDVTICKSPIVTAVTRIPRDPWNTAPMKPRMSPVCGAEKIKPQTPRIKQPDARALASYRCEKGHVFCVPNSASAGAGAS